MGLHNTQQIQRSDIDSNIASSSSACQITKFEIRHYWHVRDLTCGRRIQKKLYIEIFDFSCMVILKFNFPFPPLPPRCLRPPRQRPPRWFWRTISKWKTRRCIIEEDFASSKTWKFHEGDEFRRMGTRLRGRDEGRYPENRRFYLDGDQRCV